ncbi:MAG: helix-turn-helix domain-containing protein [Burkholderiales bacterium]
METAKCLRELLDLSERLLRAVDRRKALLAEMRALGSRIDEAHGKLQGREPSEGDVERLRAFQNRTQQAIERLRADADAVVDPCGVFHQKVRETLLEAARQRSGLLDLAQQLRRLRAPAGVDPQQLAFELLEVRQVLNRALALLAWEVSPSAPEPAAQASQSRLADALMTAGEVARLLNVSAKKIYRMSQLGTIPHVRLGGSLRFRREDIQAWVARKSLVPKRD